MGWWPRKSVIVPVDFSDDSFAALDTALELVGSPKDICVLHVMEEQTAHEWASQEIAIPGQPREEGMRNLLHKRLSAPKYADVRIELIIGNPPHGIADFAEQIDADLIVMPSHGRTGLKRLLIGSVAERVVRLAHCPVLVLRK